MLGLASTRFKRGALLQERAEAKDHCCATGHTQMVVSNRPHVSSNRVSGVKHGYWKLATRDRRRPLAVLRSSTFRRTRSRRSHRGPPSATATAASAGSRRWSARTGPRGVVQKVSNLILNINVYMEDAQSGTMKFARSVDIRGNTDESWRRGLDYLLRNYLLREP